MTEYSIYKITNTIDDMVYIGSTKNITKRWNAHLWCCKYNPDKAPKLYNHLNLVGIDNCSCSILNTCIGTSEDACKLEKQHMLLENSENLLNAKSAFQTNEELIEQQRQLAKKTYYKIKNDPELWAKEQERTIKRREAKRVHHQKRMLDPVTRAHIQQLRRERTIRDNAKKFASILNDD